MKTLKTLSSVVLMCGLLAGCGSDSAAASLTDTTASSTTAITPTTASSTTSATGTVTTTLATQSSLSTTETATLLFVREEEKLARDVYLSLNDKWAQKVFLNIATKSEQQHMDVMGTLVATYNLQDPVLDNTIGAFTDPVLLGLYQDLVMRGSTSLVEGLQVGGFIEEFDINDLQEAIAEAQAGTNPADIIVAYTNLMCGSRNHLRAFVGQLANNGVKYQAQVVPQATVDAIVNSPEEQCGK
ncbi:MAG: hypothetical protein RL122_674 [Pseudomonadota bacterium]|jgi:hypothetical protein|uniref:DUF2202 domain-containing protein n=1 Tax=Thiothrix fructosivorans TaxID=111770 RepID=A0A8B0SK60_9GAMM|nr:DUF2202 domain-containing protein [Thiothrix fructosivorans]MBO0614139.1 DUF2202 domain-containing protein [Thiothrix fructosivorans]QTX12623.1 DUF2202 domain-containing protein [Thiothrix fructosivorans]